MHLERLLQQSTRVLDIAPPDQRLASQLAADGVTRYLGLVEPGRLDQVRANGPVPERIRPLADSQVVTHSSTDLLVIRPGAGRAAWSVQEPIDARFVAVQRHRSADGLEGRIAGLLARLSRRAHLLGQARIADDTFSVFQVRHPRERQPRMYFSPVWGPDGLARCLAEANLSYVVLRWFDNLPDVEPGEDLDILVADEDLTAFRELIESEPGTQPLDLYSESGLPYSDFREAAYYPPPLAREILTSAIIHPSGFRVPAPVEHLRSLAYHATYHKGVSSGLPSKYEHDAVKVPEHDYADTLASLAAATSTDLEITMEGIDRYLADVGWRPPADALRRMSAHNTWAANLVEATSEKLPGTAELAVFLIRERTTEVMENQEVAALLDRFGFDLLLFEPLGDDAAARAASGLRGGNWGAGPFPCSGGVPALIAVAVHHAPSSPYPWLQARYPHLTNAESYELKDELRRLIQQRVTEEQTFNPIHSSDNTSEAFEYLAVALPERLPELRALAVERAGELTAPLGTVRTLSRGRRARVDVVDTTRGLVVRKTFATSFRRFLEREIDARGVLAERVPQIPPLGAVGDTWLDTPLYTDVLPHSNGRPLPLPLLRQMIDVLRRIHAAGYDVVDAKPANFVLDIDEGLKLVDLEFLYRYQSAPPPFGETMNFVGPPEDFDGDIPVGDMSYDSRWRAATGLPLDVLIDGSVRRQQVHRALARAGSLTVHPGSPPRRILGHARRLARHQRWLASRHLGSWSQKRAATTVPTLFRREGSR